MKRERITCDECSGDISPEVTSYPRKDILKLDCINVAINPGVIFDILVNPLLEQEMYFCGFKCLHNWILRTQTWVNKKDRE